MDFSRKHSPARTAAIGRTPPAPTPDATQRHRRWTSILVATALTTAMASTMAATPAQARVPAAPSHAAAATSLPTTTATDTATYVTAVYRDLFGRPVDPAGLQTWTSALRAGTPRVAVANAITSSTEYRSRLITASYNHYLDRAPDAAGLQNWLTMMAAGGTIQQMEAGFLASPEYYLRAGSTDAGWVRRLYQHVLGRSAATSEVNHWVQALRSGLSRTQVGMGFLLSTEHLTTVVDGYYVDLLGRHIDPSGRTTWVGKIQAGDRVEAIIGGIIASDEYFTRNVGVAATPTAPAPGGPPGDANTGVPAGTQLIVYDGNLTITVAGTVIDGLDVRGFVRVRAANVVIRNSIIRGPATPLTSPMSLVQSDAGPGTNLLIEDSEIFAQAPSRFVDGIVGMGFTLRRVDIHTVVDQVKIIGDNVTVDSSYLHDNLYYPADAANLESHDDNVQVAIGANIQVVNSTLEGGTNSAVMITQDRGSVVGFTFRANHADNGACTINVAEKSYGPPPGLSITNSVFGTGQRLSRCAIIMVETTRAAATVTGNTFTDGSAVSVSRGS